MSIEQFRTSKEQEIERNENEERERRLSCFLDGLCPHCKKEVDEIHSTKYDGFCSERSLHEYQTIHSVDVRNDFVQASGDRSHLFFLERKAAELGISVELFKKLHDKDGLSPAEIRAQIEEHEERKAA